MQTELKSAGSSQFGVNSHRWSGFFRIRDINYYDYISKDYAKPALEAFS